MTYDQYVEVGLETIDSGKVIRAVDRQIKRAIENCYDLNTDPGKQRTVTLKIKFAPAPDRKTIAIEYDAEVKLITDSFGADSVQLDRDGRGWVNKGQLNFDDWQAQQEAEEQINEQTGEVTRLPAHRGEGSNDR